MTVTIQPLKQSDIVHCKAILYGLPEWFGLEASNRAYIESLRELPAAVACVKNKVIGFAALSEHTESSYEISVMAVDREYHAQGAGTALVIWAESWCKRRAINWLHVKTRGPSTPDPHYEQTRRFYRNRGFEPLFESLTHWGSDDAALVLVKHVGCEAEDVRCEM